MYKVACMFCTLMQCLQAGAIIRPRDPREGTGAWEKDQKAGKKRKREDA